MPGQKLRLVQKSAPGLKSSRTLKLKNITSVESNVIIMYAKFQLHFTVSEIKNFEYFFLVNLPCMSPCQAIKLSDLDKSHAKRTKLLNKCFYVNKI